MSKVHLGDEVRDTITGFKGVATSITEFLNGCRHIGIQPPVDKAGKMCEAYSIDEVTCEVTKVKALPEGKKLTGGPMRKIPSGRIPR